MNIAQERTETAVRNVMSGDNVCGTLMEAAAKGDTAYFRRAIMPVIAAYEQEAEALRKQRDDALRDAELKRQALESVLGNVTLPAGPVREVVARAMPAHPLLKGV